MTADTSAFPVGINKQAPCRSCMDFKSWAKQQSKSKHDSVDKTPDTQKATASESIAVQSGSCPLDKDELGRSTWAFLHTMAASFPAKPTVEESADMKQFFTYFSKFYPCHVCADDLKKELSNYPPNTSSQSALSLWLCKLHNRVNVKLGKTEFDCAKVNERWRDGWADGSCDG